MSEETVFAEKHPLEVPEVVKQLHTIGEPKAWLARLKGSTDEEWMKIMLSRDLIAAEDARWHISVSMRDRVPDWEEMVMVAHELRPGVPFVIGVPPKSMWMNINPNVLHLEETKDMNLIEQWRFEGLGDTPT